MLNFMSRLDQGKNTRILALGSSNTECCYRPDVAQGWLQWMDFTLRNLYGRCFISINSGSSGQTSAELLKRFDDTVAFFKPHVVFLTVGGNDSNPDRNVSEAQYLANLKSLFGKIRKLEDCEFIYQSYYAPVFSELNPDYAERFRSCAAAGAELARKEDVICYDHLPVWEALQEKMGAEAYKKELFHDLLHLNGTGNQLWAYQMLKKIVIPEHMAQAETHFENVHEYYE